MIIEIFETEYSSSCFLLNEIQIVILTLRCPKDENRRQTEQPFLLESSALFPLPFIEIVLIKVISLTYTEYHKKWNPS